MSQKSRQLPASIIAVAAKAPPLTKSSFKSYLFPSKSSTSSLSQNGTSQGSESLETMMVDPQEDVDEALQQIISAPLPPIDDDDPALPPPAPFVPNKSATSSLSSSIASQILGPGHATQLSQGMGDSISSNPRKTKPSTTTSSSLPSSSSSSSSSSLSSSSVKKTSLSNSSNLDDDDNDRLATPGESGSQAWDPVLASQSQSHSSARSHQQVKTDKLSGKPSNTNQDVEIERKKVDSQETKETKETKSQSGQTGRSRPTVENTKMNDSDGNTAQEEDDSGLFMSAFDDIDVDVFGGGGSGRQRKGTDESKEKGGSVAKVTEKKGEKETKDTIKASGAQQANVTQVLGVKRKRQDLSDDGDDDDGASKNSKGSSGGASKVKKTQSTSTSGKGKGRGRGDSGSKSRGQTKTKTGSKGPAKKKRRVIDDDDDEEEEEEEMMSDWETSEDEWDSGSESESEPSLSSDDDMVDDDESDTDMDDDDGPGGRSGRGGSRGKTSSKSKGKTKTKTRKPRRSLSSDDDDADNSDDDPYAGRTPANPSDIDMSAVLQACTKALHLMPKGSPGSPNMAVRTALPFDLTHEDEDDPGQFPLPPPSSSPSSTSQKDPRKDIPLCRFWDNCTRLNPVHFKEEDHNKGHAYALCQHVINVCDKYLPSGGSSRSGNNTNAEAANHLAPWLLFAIKPAYIKSPGSSISPVSASSSVLPRLPSPPSSSSSSPSSSAATPTPSTVIPVKRRPQCAYGASCYRKNPIHRKEESHPGDPDWGLPPSDVDPSSQTTPSSSTSSSSSSSAPSSSPTLPNTTSTSSDGPAPAPVPPSSSSSSTRPIQFSNYFDGCDIYFMCLPRSGWGDTSTPKDNADAKDKLKGSAGQQYLYRQVIAHGGDVSDSCKICDEAFFKALNNSSSSSSSSTQNNGRNRACHGHGHNYPSTDVTHIVIGKDALSATGLDLSPLARTSSSTNTGTWTEGLSPIERLRQYLKLSQDAAVVSEDWLIECIKQKRLVNTKDIKWD